jgi:hypothetical protein
MHQHEGQDHTSSKEKEDEPPGRFVQELCLEIAKIHFVAL